MNNIATFADSIQQYLQFQWHLFLFLQSLVGRECPFVLSIGVDHIVRGPTQDVSKMTSVISLRLTA